MIFLRKFNYDDEFFYESVGKNRCLSPQNDIIKDIKN